jgi:ATP-dependent DNA ligase I
MKLDDLVRASGDVAATRARNAKVQRLAELLASLRPEEVSVAVAYLSGDLPGGAVGVGWRSLRDLPAPTASSGLDLLEVQQTLDRIRSAIGPGSRTLRQSELIHLYGRATEREQRFLSALLVGELRQGALAGVMADAVARASEIPLAEVRRAIMLAGDLGTAATAALTEGSKGLDRFRLVPLRPIQPMLAHTADSLESALARLGRAAFEWKLDGARIQVHKRDDEVAVFTRNLANVTERLPELVETIRELSATTTVLDGEAIALKPDGTPHPFQVSMSRFGSHTDVPSLRATTPLSAFFFDCLYLDGRELIASPAEIRHEALTDFVPEGLRIPRVVTDREDEAQALLEDALARGHEGVMAKSLTAPYEAGRRGAGWLKVKRAHTLDLVVLAAEWGHGRRHGWLSNLHLGAGDPATNSFVMLGKTFKGMTDEMLEWQTKRLLELEIRREGIVVYVRPELVVEVAFDGLQRSSRYEGGVALRFARIKGYRSDKKPEDADTIETVRAIYGGAA